MSQWIFQSDGNYVNFNGGGNLWRLHKDSNCISWHWDESGDLFFDVYDAEFTVKAGNIGDVIIDSVPLSTASGFPTAIRAVFTGLAGGASYLVCLPIITQIGTSVPTSINLGDTVGLNNWTRFSAGFYYNLTDTDFPVDGNKIQFIGQTDSFFIPIYSAANSLQGWIKMLATDVGGKIEIELNTKNAAGVDTDLSDIFSGPLQLQEIRVYV